MKLIQLLKIYTDKALLAAVGAGLLNRCSFGLFGGSGSFLLCGSSLLLRLGGRFCLRGFFRLGSGLRGLFRCGSRFLLCGGFRFLLFVCYDFVCINV